MAVTLNSRGTSYPSFTIGKTSLGAPTIQTGTADPTVAPQPGINGDIYIRYGSTNQLWQYVSGTWTQFGSGGSTTFPLYAPTSTASTPEYSFTSDNTSGIFSPSVGVVAIASAGAQTFTVVGDKVGINATSPGAQLTLGNVSIAGGAEQEIDIGVSNTGRGIVRLGQDASHNAYFGWFANPTSTSAYAAISTYSGTNPIVLQDAGGNVGIGTTSPSQVLSVNGVVESMSGGFMFPDSTIQTTAAMGSSFPLHAPTSSASTPEYSFTSDSTSGMFSPSPGVVGIASGGTQTVTISGNNLGIGATSPAAQLTLGNVDIYGGAEQEIDIGVTNTGIGIVRLGQALGNQIYMAWFANPTSSAAYGALSTYAGFNPLVLQDAGGNVGIGTTSPSQVLSVNGTIQSMSGGIQFPDSTIQTTAALSYTAGTGLTITSGTFAIDNTVVVTLTDTQTLTNKSIDAGQLTGTLQAAQFPALTGDVTTTAGNLNTSIVATTNSTLTTLSSLALPTTQLTGTLQASQEPAHIGDVTNIAGSLTTTVEQIQGTVVSGTTGTGNVVFSSSPTINGTLTAASISATGTITGSNISGTNTGDQTITLTGDVTGSGTETFATSIATGSVTSAKMAFGAAATNIGTLGGDLLGTLPNPTVISFGGTTFGTMASQNANSVNITGGTITGMSTPSGGSDVATKSYVDNNSAALNIHQSVEAATTASLTATYAAGTIGADGGYGVGATLTNSGTQSAFTTDGYSAVLGDRILVKNQSNPIYNGVYTVTTLGSSSVNWILTRATDYDNHADATEVEQGDFVVVINGTLFGTTAWIQVAPSPSVIGTSAINFVQFSGAQPVLTYTGDVTGSGTVNIALTLGSVNSNIGTYSAVTVNAKGLVTAATNLTGDISSSGSTTTLASVNTNVGSFGSSTAIPNFTVNAKGLITAAGTSSVIAPAGTLTGTTLASNVVTSSLTSVGTLTNLTVTNPISGSVTGTAANITATSNSTLTTLSSLSLPFTQLTGTATTSQIPSASAILSEIATTQGDILYYNGSNWVALSPGTSGQYLQTSGSSANPSWATIVSGVSSVSGDGTVISNSSSSGAITLSLASVAANKFLAGPTSGSPSTPSYRSIVATDVPTLNQNTTGTAANITATSNSTLTSLPALSLPYTQLSGTVPTWNQNTTGTASNITATTNSTLTTLSSLSLPTTQLTGTLQAAQFPALTGDVATSSGSLTSSVAKIQGTTVSGTTGTGNVVFSANASLTGTVNVGTNQANYLTFTGAATGSAPTISNAGSDTSGTGLGIAIVAKASATNSTGGPVSITAGQGVGSFGTGGAVNITGGAGGTAGGGNVNITGGAETGTGGTGNGGGNVVITAGSGGNGAGNIQLLGGKVGINTAPIGSYQLSVIQAGSAQAYFGSTGTNQSNVIIDNAAGSNGSYTSYANAGTVKWITGNSTSNTYTVYDNAGAKIFLTAATGGNLTLGANQTFTLNQTGQLSLTSPTYPVAYFASTGSTQSNLQIDNVAGGQGSVLEFKDSGNGKWTFGMGASPYSVALYDLVNGKIFINATPSGNLDLGPSQNVHINQSGQIFMNTTGSLSNSTLSILGPAAASSWVTGLQTGNSTGTNALLITNYSGTGSYTAVGFYNNGTSFSACGSIAVSGTSTAYNTTSDGRLKTNVKKLSNIGKIIDSVEPVTYDWNHTEEKMSGVGFIAQDLYKLIPESVTVGDTETLSHKEEGFKYWSVDYSKLVPYLVAEIKDNRKRIDALEKELKNIKKNKK